jgi:hypothetical protein
MCDCTVVMSVSIHKCVVPFAILVYLECISALNFGLNW